MKDPALIEQLLIKGKEAGTRVKSEFSTLTLKQLNWKPAPESWSIGQCLDHLVNSDVVFFKEFEKIIEGRYKMSTWEKWSPLTGFFGKVMVNQMQEKVKRKLSAPKIIIPASSIDAGILDRFQKQLDTLLEYIAAFSNTDLDKIHITSPVAKFVTYNLRSAITFLVSHLHRHINQAMRVKTHKEFPQSSQVIKVI